jgi:predicted aldo/keto reductase-like oxidoreductase
MNQKRLGNTGLTVSEFCLGVLPMGPLQAGLEPEKCEFLIRRAAELGVTFFDTAEVYKTQSYIGKALEGLSHKCVIATKSSAATYDDMARAFEKALYELKRNVIDIFHLHAAKANTNIFSVRKGAMDFLHKAKSQGLIKAVGISTHDVRVARLAAENDEIDVLYPIINKAGLGIVNGTLDEMLQAIRIAGINGKGVYAMKVLGGGSLISQIDESISWARAIEDIHAISIGVVSENELLHNLKIFGVPEFCDVNPVPIRQKRLYVSFFCKNCGICISECPNFALSAGEKKAIVDHGKCLLCGYCTPHCPEFAIRVV